MKISSIHITPISKFQKPSLVSFEGKFLDKILGGLKKDVFEKSEVDEIDTSNVEDISQKELEKIYDEVFDEVMALSFRSNPCLVGLDIAKPEFKFERSGDSKTIALFDSRENSIVISDDLLNKDWYLIAQKDENGQILSYLQLEPSFLITKSLKKLREMCPEEKFEPIKLSEEDKKLYYRTVLAHELRHCVQLNLAMATGDCYDMYKERILKWEEELAQGALKRKGYNKSISELEKQGVIVNDLNDYVFRRNYFIKNKPAKFLDEDTKLAFFNLTARKMNYWSVKDDIFKGILSVIDGYSSHEDYISNPMEIDASAFAHTYLFSRFPKENRVFDRNDTLLVGLSTMFFIDIKLGLQALEKRGQRPSET